MKTGVGYRCRARSRLITGCTVDKMTLQASVCGREGKATVFVVPDADRNRWLGVAALKSETGAI